jgi:hypothetical protein
VIRDHDPVDTEITRALGVVGTHDALQHQIARPQLAIPLEVLPVQRRGGLVVHKFRHIVDA